MPELDSTTLTKISELRTISNNFSEPVEVYELLKISWISTAPVYYSVIRVDEISPTLPVSPVDDRIICDSYPDYFFSKPKTGALSDDEIDLKIWDGDDAFTDLIGENGEGVKCELFLWFPAVELLLSDWQGHLRTGKDCNATEWNGKIAVGFRSPNMSMPRRAHYRTCQAIFGGMLPTQEAIDVGDCPYNKHIGGSVGNYLTGTTPYTSCPRRTKQNCTDRGVNPLFHLSHQTIVESVVNNQTKGPNLLATSRGNETNLKRPVRVVMGKRFLRGMDLLASLPMFNTRTPDRGWWKLLFEICEGPIAGFPVARVGGQHCQSAANAQYFSWRLGSPGQAAIGFTPNGHNYSSTAHFVYTYGWVNPATTTADSLGGEGWVEGLSNIRQYSDEDSYTESSTTNRAWQLVRMLTDRRWGYASDIARININSFIECGTWGHQLVDFTDPDTGEILRHVRSMSNVELNERTTQQQIEDFCWAGNFSRPFTFQGQIHVIPLKALSEAELAECPVFRELPPDDDSGDAPNIIFEKERSSLTWSQESDDEIKNRFEITFDDSTNENKEATLSVEDVDQQLAAGEVLGDTTRRVISQKESLLGVTEEYQARKMGWSLLDLGKFHEGGLRNNLEIKFKAWYLDCLELHEYKVIKVVSPKINNKFGFEYFRIKNLEPQPDLQYLITAQAYPVEYMNAFEIVYVGAPTIFNPSIPNDIIPLVFGTISYQDGILEVEVETGS